jgi:hypothetical protein
MTKRSLTLLALTVLAALPLASVVRAQDASDDSASVDFSDQTGDANDLASAYQEGYTAGLDTVYPNAPDDASSVDPSAYADAVDDITDAWYEGWANAYYRATLMDAPYWVSASGVYYPHVGVFMNGSTITGYAPGFTVVNNNVFFNGARWTAPATNIPARAASYLAYQHPANVSTDPSISNGAARVLPSGMNPTPFTPHTGTARANAIDFGNGMGTNGQGATFGSTGPLGHPTVVGTGLPHNQPIVGSGLAHDPNYHNSGVANLAPNVQPGPNAAAYQNGITTPYGPSGNAPASITYSETQIEHQNRPGSVAKADPTPAKSPSGHTDLKRPVAHSTDPKNSDHSVVTGKPAAIKPAASVVASKGDHPKKGNVVASNPARSGAAKTPHIVSNSGSRHNGNAGGGNVVHTAVHTTTVHTSTVHVSSTPRVVSTPRINTAPVHVAAAPVYPHPTVNNFRRF